MLVRLKQLRKLLGLTQSEFAESIGIKQSSYSQIEKGIRPLMNRHIKSICLIYDVNEKWLRDGIEPIFSNKQQVKELMDLYDKLTSESQSYMLEVMRGLLKLQQTDKKTETDDNR